MGSVEMPVWYCPAADPTSDPSLRALLMCAVNPLPPFSCPVLFRVKQPSNQTATDLAALQQRAPQGVTSAGNLGALDFFPATSGKENAARYLMQHFAVVPEDSVLMCDDDNDLGLAACVSKAYLPGITAPSVQAAVDAAPERFYVSQHKGWRGTEEVLKVLVEERLAEL